MATEFFFITKYLKKRGYGEITGGKLPEALNKEELIMNLGYWDKDEVKEMIDLIPNMIKTKSFDTFV